MKLHALLGACVLALVSTTPAAQAQTKSDMIEARIQALQQKYYDLHNATDATPVARRDAVVAKRKYLELSKAAIDRGVAGTASTQAQRIELFEARLNAINVSLTYYRLKDATGFASKIADLEAKRMVVSARIDGLRAR